MDGQGASTQDNALLLHTAGTPHLSDMHSAVSSETEVSSVWGLCADKLYSAQTLRHLLDKGEQGPCSAVAEVTRSVLRGGYSAPRDWRGVRLQCRSAFCVIECGARHRHLPLILSLANLWQSLAWPHTSQHDIVDLVEASARSAVHAKVERLVAGHCDQVCWLAGGQQAQHVGVGA